MLPHPNLSKYQKSELWGSKGNKSSVDFFNSDQVVTVDPSKFCHNMKKMDNVKNAKDQADVIVPVDKLTWRLEEKDSDMTKKRKGEFLQSRKPKKKMKYMQSVRSDKGINGTDGRRSGLSPQKKESESSDSESDDFTTVPLTDISTNSGAKMPKQTIKKNTKLQKGGLHPRKKID